MSPKATPKRFTKNKRALLTVFFLLSLAYIPTKLFVWDKISSLITGVPQVTLKLPIDNIKKTREKLLSNKFPNDTVDNFVLSSSIQRVNQKGVTVVKLENKVLIM